MARIFRGRVAKDLQQGPRSRAIQKFTLTFTSVLAPRLFTRSRNQELGSCDWEKPCGHLNLQRHKPEAPD
eukprot:3478239-Karenia_brevis.AAC.1